MGSLEALNEPAEVFFAGPIAAGCTNQTGARKNPHHNALLGESVDKGLRLIGPPRDQGRLVRLGDDVGAMLKEQRTAALGRRTCASEAVRSDGRCERERSQQPDELRGACPRSFESI